MVKKLIKMMVSLAKTVWNSPARCAVVGVFLSGLALKMLVCSYIMLPIVKIRIYDAAKFSDPWLVRMCRMFGSWWLDLGVEEDVLAYVHGGIWALLCCGGILYFYWGYRVIRSHVVKAWTVWSLFGIWGGYFVVAWTCLVSILVHLPFADRAANLFHKFYLLVGALVIGMLLPAALVRSKKAVASACGVLIALALFALGYYSVSPQFYGMGMVLFVGCVLSCIRWVSVSERLSVWWYWPLPVLVLISSILPICRGILLHALEDSPYSDKIELGNEVVEAASCSECRCSVLDQWYGVGNFKTAVKADEELKKMCTDSAAECLDYPIVLVSKVRSRLQEFYPELGNRGTNVLALVLAAAVRVRDAGVSCSGLPANFAINNKIGHHAFCEEMDLLSLLVETGRLEVSDWVSGILALMCEAEQEKYYLSYHFEEYACLSGLRRLLMRHTMMMSAAEISAIRATIASRKKTLALNRIRANAFVSWNWIHQFAKISQGGLSQPLGFDGLWSNILLAYCLRRQFDARLEEMVEEWNRAEFENRVPDFGRPGISVEESVTTIADAYAAIDLALAAEQYRRDCKDLPPSLEALVPQYIERVPVCMTDGSPFSYERGDLECLDEEKLPDELRTYRQCDADGLEIRKFHGYRVLFKYVYPCKDGPFRFSVPVLCR